MFDAVALDRFVDRGFTDSTVQLVVELSRAEEGLRGDLFLHCLIPSASVSSSEVRGHAMRPHATLFLLAVTSRDMTNR